MALSLGTVSAVTPAFAASVPSTYKPSRQVLLSTGEGQMVNLPRGVASVWTSNPDVADIYVTNPRQINVFGKGFGEATVIATAADGSVVYGAAVVVSPNISSINEALHRAMPDSNIQVTTLGQMAVLNGTVASPEDAAQADHRLGEHDTDLVGVRELTQLPLRPAIEDPQRCGLSQDDRGQAEDEGNGQMERTHRMSPDTLSAARRGRPQYGGADLQVGPTTITRILSDTGAWRKFPAPQRRHFKLRSASRPRASRP